MTKSIIERQIRKWTIIMQGAGLLAAVAGGLSLYLESYFSSHPTVEDLYFGTNSRAETLWAIALPVIAGLIGFVISGFFKIRNLSKHLPGQQQIKQDSREVRIPSSSKTDELIKLSKLRSEGMISESEFESLKKEII